MTENCKKLIKENKILITDFENKFEKEILRYKEESKKNLSDYKEDFVFQYVNHIYSKIYNHINETILILDINRCTIIEKPILIEQLKELYRLYFDFLERSDYKSDYWKLSEQQIQNHFDDRCTFIDVKDFNSNYVFNLITTLIEKKDYNRKVEVNKHTPKIILNKHWLMVGFYFANGAIYELYKNGTGLTGTLLKNKIFGINSSDSLRTYIICTLSNNIGKNIKKNIFKRPKAEYEINTVLSYCKQENIPVCKQFYDACNENGINIIES